MVRPKSGSSKKPNRGVDFKKIKRKIGRKLPPPKNFTDTQIKSRAIVLPEQSVALERSGLAVNKKGLTLKELLHQTSHHNAKFRKAAITGIRDLVQKHPSELKVHKVAIIEKLRERICDNDKVVRETLYHLLKTVIFPCSKEDITGPFISLLMAYVFNAMTHIAVDIRLMAFKFFELVVTCYPSSFIFYAEKVIDNYMDILRNNQIYLQDKSNLKNALGGLVHCLSLLVSEKKDDDPLHKPKPVEQRCLHNYEMEVHKNETGVSSVINKLEGLVPILVNCFQESSSLLRATSVDAQSFDCMLCTLQCINLAVKTFVYEKNKPGVSLPSLSSGPDFARSTVLVLLRKLWEAFPVGQLHSSTEKEDERCFILNVRITEIFLHVSEWIDDTAFISEKFLEFIDKILLGQFCSTLPSNRLFLEKHLNAIIPFISRLVTQVSDRWKARLLEAFTGAFKVCKVDSKLCLAYLSAIEEMIFPTKTQHLVSFVSSDTEIICHKIAWIQELPKILLQLGDNHSSASKVVLKLLLRIGQSSPTGSPLAIEYDCLQWPLKEFFSIKSSAGTICYGPFIKTPCDCQELAISCLYYFSNVNSDLLESLVCCCLCEDMDQLVLLWIVDVLHSTYKAGRVQISDQIGFLVTLIACFKIFPENFRIEGNGKKMSNRGVYKSLTRAVCLCLSQMGDCSLVLKLLHKIILNEISLKPSLDNVQGLLRIIITLDIRLAKLSEESIGNLSNWILGYLINATEYIPEEVDMVVYSDQIHIFRYYAQPCILLLYGCNKLLFYLLKSLNSVVVEDGLSHLSHAGFRKALEPLRRVCAVSSILIFMHNDVRLHKSLSSNKEVIKTILRNTVNLLDSNKFRMTLEERYKARTAFDQLKSRACKLHSWEASDVGGL